MAKYKNMENLSTILASRYKLPIKEVKTLSWQFEALEAIKKLVDGDKNKAGIFRCFKIDTQKSRIALADSLELGKPASMYFFKVFSQLRKSGCGKLR